MELVLQLAKSKETSFPSQSSSSKTTTSSSGAIKSSSETPTQICIDKDNHSEEATVFFFAEVGKGKKFKYFYLDE